MKFDDASKVEQVVWDMRLADLPRGENRLIINNLYNGDPPFDEAKAEENNIQINRNDLEGPNLLSRARQQWNTAFLNTENYFSATLDSGPVRKRGEWSRTATRKANTVLKECRNQMEQNRATGAAVMLHGIGPTIWETRRGVVPVEIPIASFLVPSETRLSYDNLEYVAFFREWTPAQLYMMTHGPRRDKGWQMDVVMSQLRYVGDQTTKQANATAFQYMPERIGELIKQDMGMWGSDAVPTIDAWDFYFREAADGKGWYRRIILDWGVTEGDYASNPKGFPKGMQAPDDGNKDTRGKFLYTSGEMKFSNCLSEIFHTNFADCSAVAPFTVHAIRSLGWMLWGICDLQNRLHCKFNEQVFQSLMWFFRTASQGDLNRLKVADFTHMGVIPAGISMVLPNERYQPPMEFVNLAFQRNRALMQESAASYSQDFTKGAGEKEMTATETMARVNTVNALVSGMLSLAYTYEDYKYKEQFRRLCIPNNPDPLARRFRKGCLKDGIPPEFLDAERWRVQSERILGAGNKTLALAQAQFLQGIRKNLGPDAQREVDHISIEINTDDPVLAEKLAPVANQKTISDSMHDAQLSTERLMRGLPFVARPDMVYEDYVKVWLADLGLMVGRNMKQGGMATANEIQGYQTMAQQITQFLGILAQDPEEKQKVRAYQEQLTQSMNQVKAFAQRLQQAAKAANGHGAAPDPAAIAKLQIEKAKGDLKLRNMEQSHGARTAQKQVQFELQQQREDRATNAEIRRENAKAGHEIIRDRTKSLNSLADDSTSQEPP